MPENQDINIRIVKKLRLIDDDFMRLYFSDNIEGVEFLLNVILQRDDLKVIRVETQCEYRSLSGRSITLDIYAEDSAGMKYNIEIQRADKGAIAKRARFNSSMVDTKLLKKNEPFENLSETFVIFITENDIFGHGLPFYRFDRWCEKTQEYLNDEAHIIYVNGAYQNPEDNIGRLMHDFMCADADDMYNNELSERFRYFKETEGGKGKMCKLIEERAKEYADECLKAEKVEDIKRMLNENFSYETIAKCLNVSTELVEEVANGKVA